MAHYISVRNPKYTDPEHTKIDLEVNFSHEPEEYVPFTASADDPEAHGRELHQRALDGDFGEIAPYQTPADITGEEALEKLRRHRAGLLEESDIAVLPDRWASMTSEKQAEWSAYRQALRDLPANSVGAEYRWVESSEEDLDNGIIAGYTNEININWPTKPSE